MSIKAILHNAIPGPWQPRRVFNKGWAHEVFSAEGKSLDTYYVDRTEGAMLSATQAMGPEMLDYVMRAAAKGGAEAIQLKARFDGLCEELANGRAP